LYLFSYIYTTAGKVKLNVKTLIGIHKLRRFFSVTCLFKACASFLKNEYSI